MVCNQPVKKCRDLYSMCIDYRKAFDSVPHDWLVRVLKLYKIDEIIQVLLFTMRSWRTRMVLFTSNEKIVTEQLSVKRGIFQGDTFSLLWFILGLNPLSIIRNAAGQGFAIKQARSILYHLNHLLLMDDLKMYAATKEGLQYLLGIVKSFSDDIRMDDEAS